MASHSGDNNDAELIRLDSELIRLLSVGSLEERHCK
jgi:hypothetical protein